MAYYSVTYTLESKNSDSIFKKNLSGVSNGKFIENAHFQYLFKSNLEASEIMDTLCNNLTGENKILILKINTSDWCHLNLGIEMSDWLQSSMSVE